MYLAQQIQLLRKMNKILLTTDVTRLFVNSDKFEDQFNIFFNDFNTIIKYLFYIKNTTLSRKDLYELLKAYERGIPFSILCYDHSLSTSLHNFIVTIFQINKKQFLFDSLLPILSYFLNVEQKYVDRLINIIGKNIQYQVLLEDEQRLLNASRTLSVENILEKYKDEIIDQPEVLPEWLGIS
jgi:hypothetical protein